MKKNVILFLAMKDTFKDKKMFLLVVGILALSFVNIIFFSGFIAGMTDTIQDQIIGVMSAHILIIPKENHDYVEHVSSIQKKIEAIPGVVAVAPHNEVSGTIKYKSKSRHVSITGVVPSREERVTEIPYSVAEGEFLSDSDTDEVCIGIDLRSDESDDSTKRSRGEIGNIQVGNRVTITYGNGVVKDYRVKCILDAGFDVVDGGVYLTTKEVEEVHGIEDKTSQILIKIADKDAAEEYKLKIMQENVGGEIKTWKDIVGFVEQMVQTLNSTRIIMSVVGILTAVMTMGIIIYINTQKKKRQIGILKAIGATDNTILKIFLLESVLFGLIGVIMGVIAVQGITYYFNNNPVSMPMGELKLVLEPTTMIISAGVLLIGVIVGGMYPAWRAAKIDIVKAVWG